MTFSHSITSLIEEEGRFTKLFDCINQIVWTIYLSIYLQFLIYTTLLRHTKLLVKYLFLNIVFIYFYVSCHVLVSLTYLNINWRMSVCPFTSHYQSDCFAFQIQCLWVTSWFFKESPLHMSDHFVVLFFFLMEYIEYVIS